MAYVPIRKSGSSERLVGFKFQRGFIFGAIMVAALGAFELFNFGTTEYALTDLLGGARVLGVGWASVLAVAFCAIDFAGLARLFTPEQGADEPKEVWFLMGAWFLGAAANAVMTWWAITLTLLPRQLGNEILSREQLLSFVPVFVALLVWLTRILIIGTFGVAGERLFTVGSDVTQSRRSNDKRSRQLKAPSATYRPAKSSRSAPRPSSPRSYSSSTGKRRANVDDEEDEEELVYEPVNEVGATYNPRSSRGRTRPSPKPGGAPRASYGYSASPATNGEQLFAAATDWLHRANRDEGELKT